MPAKSAIIGGFPFTDPECLGCGELLRVENAWMADGCPCNSELGVNNVNETRWRLLMELQRQSSWQTTVDAMADRIRGAFPEVWIGPALGSPRLKWTAKEEQEDGDVPLEAFETFSELLQWLDDEARPEPAPDWHDRPTCAGRWLVCFNTQTYGTILKVVNIHEHPIGDKTEDVRYYGPIPEDER